MERIDKITQIDTFGKGSGEPDKNVTGVSRKVFDQIEEIFEIKNETVEDRIRNESWISKMNA